MMKRDKVKEIARLTDLEVKIMRVLWEHEQSLTIQEITQYMKEDGISVASVTQAIKHLTKKKAVAVSEHVLVSNVYARTFITCFTQEEFLASEVARMQRSIFGAKKLGFGGVRAVMASLLENDGEKLGEEEERLLQGIINAKKETAKKGEG